MLARFHGLGWDTMLEYGRYPNSGIGSYVVSKGYACHHREIGLGQVGINRERFHMVVGKGVAVCCCICAVCLCL